MFLKEPALTRWLMQIRLFGFAIGVNVIGLSGGAQAQPFFVASLLSESKVSESKVSESKVTKSKVVESEIAEPLYKASANGFFFIQLSDAHVYNRKSDFGEFSSPQIPWFIPQLLADYLAIESLKKTYGENVADHLRDALNGAPNVGATAVDSKAELDGWSDVRVYQAYKAAWLNPQGVLGTLDEVIRQAMAEVVGFQPAFVVNTGDLVLEGNNGTAEAVERWFKYYLELTEGQDTIFYNTIGNNELAGTDNHDFALADPRYGKYFFRKYIGQTHFSFDYEDFHFIALDTHLQYRQADQSDRWDFYQMPVAVYDWAKRDLQAHQQQTLVVLNHEPFHFDTAWPFANNGSSARDAGLFKEFGVEYVLSGHTHYRSYQYIDGVHHITTGALSGMRWALPASIHARGYRFFYALDQALYSAWKPTGEAMMVLAEPQPIDQTQRIIMATASRRAFAEIRFEYQGEVLSTRRLGQYFYQVAVPDRANSDKTRIDKARSDKAMFDKAMLDDGMSENGMADEKRKGSAEVLLSSTSVVIQVIATDTHGKVSYQELRL
ncbi:MAG: metallophosphoesterase [Pseudomonadales bacterium]|nr:metallophosphoesterase [Pseudomonadales bacterium]